MSQEVMNELVSMSQEIIKLKDQNRELLAALKLVMSWVENWSPEFTQDDEWAIDASRISAAIAKATQPEQTL